ncbi:MAG: GTPase HflX [Bacteroidetes bacterium CG02_land_8_20_14_3_00_31_25]|nr:GTPase HflX [Bacteroidota bacterium]PIV57994.1 MAG: GTPase HflX [Bacteroidetes bacterium CG02_land_8_20_14_3_00_31_25]PIY03722.1 MAG: GTPase HflX [Bacteroidetes bacterium CG_4_10_14_3_um_filter_31_20]
MLINQKKLTNNTEKAVLISVIHKNQNEKQVKEFLDELEFLALTAGAVTVKKFIQRITEFDSRTFIGKGKLDEIAKFINEKDIRLTIFDDELSGSQLKNIENVLKCKVLDRTNLILDIFAARAKTAYAKVQVELAQYQYLLPRLTKMWSHLERQKGGIGLRGPGEKELETDRRVIKWRISILKEQLNKIDKQMSTQRKKRNEFVRIALVGYTNAGKSTIINLLSKSNIFAENKLFATLDTTVRKVVIGNLPFLLSDTVGFIRKLPHSLIEAFNSTLNEIREADILLHVVDVSHQNFEEQINIVNQTLHEIKVSEKQIIIIFNKIDKYIPAEPDDLITQKPHSLSELKNSWLSKNNKHCLFISATKKENIDEFKKQIFNCVSEIYSKIYPNNNNYFYS